MNDPIDDATVEPSLSTELRVDSVCQRFEAAWKAGKQPSPEDYATGWDGEERQVLLRELVLIDMDYRKRGGETPSPDDYRGYYSTATSSAMPAAAVADADEVLPRPFGRYTLRRLLGKGGMGRVYLAHDSQLDRLVALKMPNLVEGVAGWRDRFLTEARSAATLSHPNVCPVHDVGEVDGQPYLTMAYIEGETLAQKFVRDGRFAPDDAVELVRTVARAMQEAHRRGIIHRDLKPANLMLDSSDRPIIMDFGLAIRSTAADDLRLTLTGVALGTPAYMPPEQAGGDSDSIGPTADVYSLGVVLYELLTGRTPFAAKSFGKLLAMIERDPPPLPTSFNPAVDPALEAIILTALAKSPAERFADAGGLADALDDYLEGDRSQVLSRYSKPYRIADATAEYRPAPTADSTAVFGKRRGWGRLLAGAAALLMVAIAAAVVYVETDYGQLVIQISDPNAKVDVTVNGQEVTLDQGGGRSVRVRSGPNNKLVISGPDFKTVAETYEVTRGDATIARVTLIPKEGKTPPVAPDPKPGETPKTTLPQALPPSKNELPAPKKPDSPKSTPYPTRSTIVEMPGWQILADATKEEMKLWIAERKKSRHTVTWVDATTVAGKPLFTAVAALDERQPGWTVLFDVPANASTAALRQRINMEANYMVAGGCYEVDREPLAALLWWPGSKRFAVVANASTLGMKRDMPEVISDGYLPRVLRANAASDGTTRWLAYHSVDATNKTEYSLELTTEELQTFLDEARHKDMMPISIAGWVKDELPLFSSIVAPRPAQWEWQADANLTIAEFAAKATGMAAKGFRPACVTAYPWDGAVRYCAIWVKEPPKPVEYPKGPKLIEVPGWQILTDATKGEMQKWLDERKKAKHSVTWLDAIQVADKPLFTAVAALDDRAPGWHAFLELECVTGETILESFGAVINVKTHWPVSISTYHQSKSVYAVALWQPGVKGYIAGIGVDPTELDKTLKPILTNGLVIHRLRPYLVERGVVSYALIVERNPGETSVYASGMTSDQLTEFLEQQRAKRFYPTSVAAAPQDGKMLFSATMSDQSAKAAWEVDVDLTSQAFEQKAREMVARGFVPTSSTAYPWDGKVRYCVVWVKEPPKPVEYPKGPTLIEMPGWQVYVDATKEEMKSWLDDRKKDKHSAIWLDAVQVGDRPVFAAVAATDDRSPGWKAFLDTPVNRFGSGEMAKEVNAKSYHPLSASGYLQGGSIKSVTLWRNEFLPFYLDPEATPTGLKIADKQLTQSGGVVRSIRPFHAGTVTAQGVFGHKALGEKGTYLIEGTLDQLNDFVKDRRLAGDRITGFVALEKDGQLFFTIVGATNLEKIEWKLDHGLTAGQLKAKCAVLQTEHFHPSCVTAYAWDGAVRYCVVWVKETPKNPVPAKDK